MKVSRASSLMGCIASLSLAGGAAGAPAAPGTGLEIQAPVEQEKPLALTVNGAYGPYRDNASALASAFSSREPRVSATSRPISPSPLGRGIAASALPPCLAPRPDVVIAWKPMLPSDHGLAVEGNLDPPFALFALALIGTEKLSGRCR